MKTPMTRKVVILTGSELRHTFFRKALALCDGIEVLASLCEGDERSLRSVTDAKSNDEATGLRLAHVLGRERAEADFFGPFVALAPDRSHPRAIAKGAINDPTLAADVAALQPDVLVAYGCSLVREPLLSAFAGRFLNVHLGLSPYYRGSGTNFWPLANGEPEYVGATFMHIDAGIDTGDVLHQIRARIHPDDGPHQIGNRLIADMTLVYAEIIRNFSAMTPRKLTLSGSDHNYRVADFSEGSVAQMRANFETGMVERYLAGREARCTAVPIVESPLIRTNLLP